MSEARSLAKLKELSGRLQALLADPHPDLFTWNAAVLSACREMGDFGDDCRPHLRRLAEAAAMLKESAKQHRLRGDDGHAVACETRRNNLIGCAERVSL